MRAVASLLIVALVVAFTASGPVHAGLLTEDGIIVGDDFMMKEVAKLAQSLLRAALFCTGIVAIASVMLWPSSRHRRSAADALSEVAK